MVVRPRKGDFSRGLARDEAGDARICLPARPGGNKIAPGSVEYRKPQVGEPEPLREQRRARFDQAVLPHLGAAYNLARWLTRDAHDADDVVQEAYLRAYQFFDSFHGGDGRAWLLRIVRNTCYTWLEKNRPREPAVTFDETRHGAGVTAAGPDAPLMASEDQEILRQALAALPEEFREVIVLRELEGMSYREIAAVTSAPLGTVMSRLARARERLQEGLARRRPEER
jgi:RNA polymerase sigma factor (sigma-70 family)